MTLKVGQRVANYEILGSLGSGAMGEVYRARDTQLEREVAIKVLPEEWATDPKRRTRFEQEARTLAALNHQNVAQIYGIDTSTDTSYLALELVPGEELAARINKGPLPMADAIDLCHQVATGLQAAHDEGVIHRDLKPANIRITPDETAKILDFGLAKSVRASDDKPLSTMTEAGALVGTPAYMSPEQVRGRAIDRRADIWAFGCVLFEALTGTRPFDGESLPDVLAGIVERQPDLGKLPTNTPREIRRLLERCLDKDPHTRLQDIGEARIVLEGKLDTTSNAATTATGTRKLPLLLVAIAAAVTTLLVSQAFGGNDDASWNPLERARFSKLTNFRGTEYDASISPDGKFVAFVSDRDGRFSVLVGPVGGESFVNLTEGNTPFFNSVVRESGFHHSSLEVWLGGAVGKRMRIVSLQGGEPRNLLTDKTVEVDWSPDGSRKVFHTKGPGDPLFVEEPDGTRKRISVAPAGTHQHYPTWSPHDGWIYFVRGRPATEELQLWRLRPDGSSISQLTTNAHVRRVTYPTPIDEDRILFTAKDPEGGGPWLWILNIGGGAPRRVTLGLEQYTSVDASKDGRRVVATVAHPEARLWRVPIEDKAVGEDAVKLVDEVKNLRALAPRFGGQDLYHLSSRGTGDGLWLLRNGEIKEVLRGAENHLLEPPAISPNNDWIAVVLDDPDGRRRSIYVLENDGTERRKLKAPVDVRGAPCWSHDGKWIITGGNVGPVAQKGLFRIPVDGGQMETIAKVEALDPVCSPKEDLIVFAGEQVSSYSTLVAVRSDGTKVDLPKIEVIRGGERVRFLPDGRGFVYMKGMSHKQDFWLLDLETKKPRRLTNLETVATMLTFDVAPDGKSIVFDRIEEKSDVVLIELPEPSAR